MTDPNRLPNVRPLIANLPTESGVVLRHFGQSSMVEQATWLAKLCKRHRHIFLVAADPKLARAVDAQGVHWPQARLSEARRWRGAFALQTASAHNRRDIVAAHRAGMDAALLSTVFPSNSPTAGRALGPLKLRSFAQDSPLSFYALGGVHADNAGQIGTATGFAMVEGATIFRNGDV
ncbi:MAG: thiamine phosphate synthase [Pseudomonadota bacterium]